MRCYFFRNGRIEGVEFLSAGTNQYLILQAKTLFGELSCYDGFEVWDGKRFVYRYSFDKQAGIFRATNEGKDDACLAPNGRIRSVEARALSTIGSTTRR